MSKYKLYILSFCFVLANLNSNSLKSNIYNNQNQEDFNFNNSNSISFNSEVETFETMLYIGFIILQSVISLIYIVCIYLRIYKICDQHFKRNLLIKELISPIFEEEKYEKELLLINEEDYAENKIDKSYLKKGFKNDVERYKKLYFINNIEIENISNNTIIYEHDSDMITSGIYTNLCAGPCICIFSFVFIFPYRGPLMIPCLIPYCLTIYLGLVLFNISLCRVYNNEDIKDLINCFEKISKPLYFKEGEYSIPYKECIDFSGSLNLENNQVYNLQFTGIELYCKNKKNLIKKLEMKEGMVFYFQGNHFFSDIYNIWMFIHIFTLTSCFYNCYINCCVKKVNFTFKKLLILDDDDFTLSEKKYYESIGLSLKYGNQIIKFDNISKLSEESIKQMEEHNEIIKKELEERQLLKNLKKLTLLETIGSEYYNAKVYLNEEEKDENKKIIVITFYEKKKEKIRYYPMDANFKSTIQIKTDLDKNDGYEIEVKAKKFGKPIIYKHERKYSDDSIGSYSDEELILPDIFEN